MGMRQYRQEAHEALRPLWLACNDELQRDTVSVLTHPNGSRFLSTQTEIGTRILRKGDVVSLENDYIRYSEDYGLLEGSYVVTFPADIRDLSESSIRDEWNTAVKSGIRVVGIRDYPKIAREILQAF